MVVDPDWSTVTEYACFPSEGLLRSICSRIRTPLADRIGIDGYCKCSIGSVGETLRSLPRVSVIRGSWLIEPTVTVKGVR